MARKVIRELRGQKENPDRTDHRVHPGCPAKVVKLPRLESRVHRVLPETPEKEVHRD